MPLYTIGTLNNFGNRNISQIDKPVISFVLQFKPCSNKLYSICVQLKNMFRIKTCYKNIFEFIDETKIYSLLKNV